MNPFRTNAAAPDPFPTAHKRKVERKWSLASDDGSLMFGGEDGSKRITVSVRGNGGTEKMSLDTVELLSLLRTVMEQP